MMGGMQQPPEDLQPVTDLWTVSTSIGSMLRAWENEEGIQIGMIVPGGHAAYARIMHPAWDGPSRTRRVRWREVAASSGARLEGTVAFRRITVPPGTPVPLGPSGAWDEDATPEDGTLPEAETLVLLRLLAPFTSTMCWFLLWEGWDGLRLDPNQVEVPWLGNPHLVFRGPLEVVPRFRWTHWQTPHLWFPEDRAWCVGTYLDSYETYVGGSAELIDQVLTAPELETLSADGEDLAIVSGEWLLQ